MVVILACPESRDGKILDALHPAERDFAYQNDGENKMPKLKTKKAAEKRIKITKTGKIIHGKVTTSHLRRKESVSRKHRKNRPTELSKANRKRIKKLLPYR